MKTAEICAFWDDLLDVKSFGEDCSNNGLQAACSQEADTVAFGVDACGEFFRRAAEAGAQIAAVHHGLSWGNGFRRLTGLDAERMAMLFRSGLSLYAAHLPLDAHPELGNNAQLAGIAGLEDREDFFPCCGHFIGVLGTVPGARPAAELLRLYEEALNARGHLWGDAGRPVKRLAVVSGQGGLDGVLEASKCGADALLTGDFDHVMYHPAKELGLTVLSLGHYATETVGIRALMRRTQDRTGLKCVWIDLPTEL